MRSKVVHTDIIDDMEDAVEEIREGFSDFVLCKNSMGVIFAEEDVEYEELYGELSKYWDFSFIGCTTMCMISGEGFLHGGISVMIMTGDDVNFSAGITGRLTGENYKQELTDLYDRLSSELDDEVKLIYGYSDSIKSPGSISGQAILNLLNEYSNGTLMFGGVASDDMDYSGSKIFFNGSVKEEAFVMALISGNIEPKYVHVVSLDDRISPSYTITRSDDNVVYKLGDYTLTEVLEREGFNTDKHDVLREYLQTPFLLTREVDGEKITMARSISFINHEDGSGVFLGEMPEGATLEIGYMNREYVKSSLDKAMNYLIKETQESDHEYSTTFCCSCISRYLVLSSQIEGEADGWTKKLPEGISFMGMYSYGEVCPVRSDKTGKGYNAFHNITFTMMAI